MRCNGCETEINGKTEDHYDRSPNCKIWIDLMNDETNVANIAKTIQDVYIEQTQHSLTCDNCEATYSNLGNINKHYKNHPECLKINLFNKIKKKSKAAEERRCVEYGCTLSKKPDLCVITPKEYYHNWPDSLYNQDLVCAKDAILEYLKEPRKVSSQKECIVFDLDDTLIFGDPSDTVGIKEMELGTSSEGNEIFALPVVKEIVEVARYSKSIGLHVVVMSARPKESYTASVTNLNMFGIEYDQLIHYNDNDTLVSDVGIEDISEYKLKKFESLSKKYDIICTVGDQEGDCYINSPFSVKLPDPKCMKVKIYHKNEVKKTKEVQKEPKEQNKELDTYVFGKCLHYTELCSIHDLSNEFSVKDNIYTKSTYSDIVEVQAILDQVADKTDSYSNRMEYINDSVAWTDIPKIPASRKETSELTKIFIMPDVSFTTNCWSGGVKNEYEKIKLCMDKQTALRVPECPNKLSSREIAITEKLSIN